MPPIANVLLLAEDESRVSLDRAVLRRLGIARVRFLSRGQDALRVLKSLRQEFPPLDMVICHERLADMTGFAFLQSLRQDAALRDLPLVLLAGNRESAVARSVLGFGGCSLLARPYTQDEALAALSQAQARKGIVCATALAPAAPSALLKKVLPLSASVAGHNTGQPVLEAPAPVLPLEGASNAAVAPKDFEPAARPAPYSGSGVEMLFRKGFAAMRAGDTAIADQTLRRVFDLDPFHAEACIALSKIHNGLGLEKESQIWLCRAGVACLRRHEPGRAHDIFSRLPRVKDGSNPLVPEATRLLQEGESRAAAFAFLEAQSLEPERPLHTLIGRACLFTEAPEKAMRSLCKALAHEGYESTARSLQNRLFSDVPAREQVLPSQFWDRFPLLRDIVSVASFTFSAWRQAA